MNSFIMNLVWLTLIHSMYEAFLNLKLSKSYGFVKSHFERSAAKNA